MGQIRRWDLGKVRLPPDLWPALGSYSEQEDDPCPSIRSTKERAERVRRMNMLALGENTSFRAAVVCHGVFTRMLVSRLTTPFILSILSFTNSGLLMQLHSKLTTSWRSPRRLLSRQATSQMA